jgi:hypothetical protein
LVLAEESSVAFGGFARVGVGAAFLALTGDPVGVGVVRAVAGLRGTVGRVFETHETGVTLIARRISARLSIATHDWGGHSDFGVRRAGSITKSFQSSAKGGNFRGSVRGSFGLAVKTTFAVASLSFPEKSAVSAADVTGDQAFITRGPPESALLVLTTSGLGATLTGSGHERSVILVVTREAFPPVTFAPPRVPARVSLASHVGGWEPNAVTSEVAVTKHGVITGGLVSKRPEVGVIIGCVSAAEKHAGHDQGREHHYFCKRKLTIFFRSILSNLSMHTINHGRKN